MLGEVTATTGILSEPRDVNKFRQKIKRGVKARKLLNCHFVIQNKHTKNFYKKTLLGTDLHLHLYTKRRDEATTYCTEGLAIRDALKIRGRMWMREFVILSTKTVREYGEGIIKSSSKSKWQKRYELIDQRSTNDSEFGDVG